MVLINISVFNADLIFAIKISHKFGRKMNVLTILPVKHYGPKYFFFGLQEIPKEPNLWPLGFSFWVVISVFLFGYKVCTITDFESEWLLSWFFPPIFLSASSLSSALIRSTLISNLCEFLADFIIFLAYFVMIQRNNLSMMKSEKKYHKFKEQWI